MGRVKQTEKSGSKEKKEKSVSKKDAVKATKSIKPKDKSSVANFQSDEPPSRARTEKAAKAQVTNLSNPSDPTEANTSTGPSLKAAGKRKESKAKSDESISNLSKVAEEPKKSSSKKRVRDEPEMATLDEAKPSVKRKKVDSRGKKAIESPALGKKREESVPSEASGDSENDTPGAAAEQEEDEVYLHGFSTDEDSSDDDELMEQDPLEVKNLPSKAKDDAEVKRRLDAAKKKPTADRGVLYIGRIPHGFYEEQMKEYFSQFGNVTRLRLARNKKTGKSKHYGFIEFDSSSVAQIVSDTMDNYLLAGHLLQCKMIATEQLHPDLWVGSNKKWKRIPKGRIARLAHNKTRTEAQQTRAEERLLKRQAEKEAKLKAAGISYPLSKVGYIRTSA